jgi:hypothetical protein
MFKYKKQRVENPLIIGWQWRFTVSSLIHIRGFIYNYQVIRDNYYGFLHYIQTKSDFVAEPYRVGEYQ